MHNHTYRKICYAQLVNSGYDCPQLFFERKMGDTYSSYWGSEDRRMEVFYNIKADELSVYELAFISCR